MSEMKENKKNIVLGVTGGIACYKAADLTSRLVKDGFNVDVIMTPNACNFVSPLTFQTLSKNQVVTDTFAAPKYWEVEHVALAKKADVFVIAPATADIIGKIANGIADDMLSTTVMATGAKVVIAPAMNVNMYENVIVQENIAKLRRLGYLFVEPGAGMLACGDVGKGRMAEPAEIAEFVASVAAETGMDPEKTSVRDLEGKRILVTAGPTVEEIDPVRYISNRSSGKMGFSVAEAALERGAVVTLVAGPVNLECSSGIRRIDVKSTEDMLKACLDNFDDTDIVIKAAAPADFRVENKAEHKIKKTDGNLCLNLTENPDILATLGSRKQEQIMVGFAAETRNLEKYAREKIKKKNLDMIVANNVAAPGAGFDKDTNIITVIRSADGSMTEYPIMSKRAAADVILDNVLDILRSR